VISPSLGAALDACAGMWVNVEIKNDPNEADFDPTDAIADATVAALVSRGDPHRWLISSFRREVIDRCRHLAPEIRTAFLCVEVPAGIARALEAAGHHALHPYYRNATEGVIAECHRHGVEVNVWTCDRPDDMRRLAAWGVDGICTNVPDVALATLAASAG
jgi:glycerophosphoryl diester phosphodiesterase